MVKIYHHNDADGKISGGIIYDYERSFVRTNPDEIECIEIDYTKIIDISTIENWSTVYFVDYSFSINENIYALIKLVNEKQCTVVWIDHHATSEELLFNSDKLKAILTSRRFYSYIDTKYCAAYLCYEWTYNKITASSTCIEDAPCIIRYVDSWDTWKHNMPNTMEFNNGFYLQDVTPENFNDAVMDGELSKYYYNKYIDSSEGFVEDCISKGSIIKDYNEISYNKLREKSSFEFYIVDKNNNKSYNCVAINGRGNSFVFGGLIDKYDIVCLFRYDHNQWVYSLYTKNNNINCCYIAEALGSYECLGGGGHKGAAGFQTNTCILDNDCTIYFKKRRFFKSLFGEYNVTLG